MGLYETLNNNISIDRHSLFGGFSVDPDGGEMSSEERHQFDVVRNALSIFEKVEASGAEFSPAIIFYGDKRTFGPQDFTEDDYNVLKGLDFESLPVTVRAKIADLLWVEKKEYVCAKIALSAYNELFELWFSEEDWIIPMEIMDRILCISAQISETNTNDAAYELLVGHLKRIDGNDEGFLSIHIVERLLGGKRDLPEDIIGILDKIILRHKDDTHKVETAYLLKKKYYEHNKDVEMSRRVCLDLALYYANCADFLGKESFRTVTMAEKYYIKAIGFYRNNGEKEEAEKLQKRLVEIQKKKPAFMAGFKNTYDVSELNKWMNESFADLSFEEAIIRLTQFTSFKSYESMKNAVFDDLKSSPISHMFGQSMINEKGQTIINLPPLDLSDPEKDMEVLDKHIHRKYYSIEDIEGNLFLNRAIHIIQSKYAFEESDLDFITCENAIIPKGRERIVRKGVYAALAGDYYTALHILAPQVENIFRTLAEEVGALTVTLKEDGTSMEKVLSSVFDLPELVDCYEGDILFTFKGLLNEQAGANIRNNIAHGIMNEGTAFSGASVYFLCATIKMLSFTSVKCMEVYDKCEKLKELKDPGKRIVPTIIK